MYFVTPDGGAGPALHNWAHAWSTLTHLILRRVLLALPSCRDYGRCLQVNRHWREVGLSDAAVRARWGPLVLQLKLDRGLVAPGGDAAKMPPFVWQMGAASFDLAGCIQLWRSERFAVAPRPHASLDDGGRVVVCVRKRPLLAALGEAVATAADPDAADGEPALARHAGRRDPGFSGVDHLTAYNVRAPSAAAALPPDLGASRASLSTARRNASACPRGS